jgi:hypothetical protein
MTLIKRTLKDWKTYGEVKGILFIRYIEEKKTLHIIRSSNECRKENHSRIDKNNKPGYDCGQTEAEKYI